ncbi:MAG: M28 family peptidase [Deltaproteobacteria bacterium]|nr:M28 family peptidase [Deltaproteobacteria bacterium]
MDAALDADEVRGVPGARERFEARVRALEAFGHRGSATANEARAAEYLAGELRGLGLEPRMEPFAGLTSCGAAVLLHMAMALVGAALVWTSPFASLALSLVALVSILLENGGRMRLLSLLVPSSPSRNVEARISPAGARAGRIVVLGHYDTQRTGLIWKEGLLSRIAPLLARSPGPMKSPLFLPMVAMLLAPVAALLAIVLPGHALVTVLALGVLAILGVTTVLLAEWAIGPFVPGASDNATGAAAVLSVVESWRADPVEGVELVALLTGCEESGLYGSAAWVRAHAGELCEVPTRFVNLDSFGYGRPRYLGCEHSLAGVPAKYPTDVVRACAAAAQELGLEGAGPRALPVQSDAFPFLRAGVGGATILCFQDDGHMPNYHQLTDTSDRLDFDVAWQAVRYGEAVTRSLAGVTRASS